MSTLSGDVIIPPVRKLLSKRERERERERGGRRGESRSLLSGKPETWRRKDRKGSGWSSCAGTNEAKQA